VCGKKGQTVQGGVGSQYPTSEGLAFRTAQDSNGDQETVKKKEKGVTGQRLYLPEVDEPENT